MLRTRPHEIKNSLTLKTQRAVELASEKGASNWLTVIPIDEMGFTLNKDEFRDALKLRYDWEIADKPSICVCGDVFKGNLHSKSSLQITRNNFKNQICLKF